MKRVAKLVSRTPPEGLTDWSPVRDDLEYWGLVYEAVWVPDRGLRNCDKTREVQAFEDLWLSWVRAGAKRDERGRPVMQEPVQSRASA